MKALSLFSGIGGIDLACEWAGIETVAFCEREPFPQKVLKKHWPDVPIYDDVCTLTKERLEQDGVIGRGRTIDLIHGGYPCQPFSSDGKRKGAEDDRHLWPEMLRIIREIKPRWVVGENVVGHITLGLDTVLSDLEQNGYEATALIIPAGAIGAPHRRDRVFVLAYSSIKGLQEWELSERLEKVEEETRSRLEHEFKRFSSDAVGQWSAQPRVLGVAHGFPDRIHRTKALGNAVVPQQIFPILAAIKIMDEENQNADNLRTL